MTVLAYNVRWWRSRNDTASEQLARDAGVSVGTLRRLEAGHRVERRALDAIAAHIGMDADIAFAMMLEPADDQWERDIEYGRPPRIDLHRKKPGHCRGGRRPATRPWPRRQRRTAIAPLATRRPRA